ncbi:MAG: CoA-binding protein, partial [Casimicrobiaceae bacterium]
MPVNGLQQHYLRPLLLPESVAIVGASERAGSIGRVVFENVIRGAFTGRLHAVNPRHREVMGHKSWANLKAIGGPLDLAIIAVPPEAVRDVLDDGGHAGLRAAIVLSHPPDGNAEQQRKWTRDIANFAARRGVRLVGPGAFGLVRGDIGLNASITDAPVARGGLALIAQSGAMCTAMLDFAATRGIGFSTVISLGAAADIGFGEMLDCMLIDRETDGILLYIESVGAARPFL